LVIRSNDTNRFFEQSNLTK